MFTKLFWKDTVERVVSTVAQFLLVIGGADGAGFLNLDLKTILGLSVAGGVASLLKALAANAKANTDTASFTVDTKELN